MKHFTFSPTVLSILNEVLPELAPETAPYDLERIAHPTSDAVVRTHMWKHVLALHLRRGREWEQTCTEKGERAA